MRRRSVISRRNAESAAPLKHEPKPPGRSGKDLSVGDAMTRLRSSVLLLSLPACLVLAGCVPGAEKPEIQSFESNGVKIAYFVQGKGEPVVLIHGWLSSAGINWVLPGTASLLAKDYQVIGIDVRGHGLSDKPNKEEQYGAELVEDVVRLLDHLKIKKAHIVGYSMGGIIAANIVVKYPDRVLSGTLGGMGWLKEGGIPEKLFAQIGKNDPNADSYAICGRSLAKLSLTEDDIKSIKVPMTILIGSDDDMMKGLYVDPLKKVRSEWPVVEIKDGNHLSCIMKQQFREEIAAWLKKNSK
jgi:pimeloyl-ACP methyl ester carboxylesterase